MISFSFTRCFLIVVVECLFEDDVAIFVSSAGIELLSRRRDASISITSERDLTPSSSSLNSLPDVGDISRYSKPVDCTKKCLDQDLSTPFVTGFPESVTALCEVMLSSELSSSFSKVNLSFRFVAGRQHGKTGWKRQYLGSKG